MRLPKQATSRPEQQQELPGAAQPIALYIHIPFCETKCPYCDFNTYAGIEALMPDYIDALVQEVRLWGAALGRPDGDDAGRWQIGTVFFGGGTPSYLPPEHIQRVLDAVRTAFHLSASAEITLESNPGDVAAHCLQAWKEAGINRLSIGVQSMDDGLLQLLGRRHSAEMARQAYHASRLAGFDNVNLDLMYGLPGQTRDQWEETLTETLNLGPEHLSLYCLTLEEGTPMEEWVRQGKILEPDPDLAADMYLLAEEMAEKTGYEHYEISSWALPKRECHHNLTYWRNLPYLGVGPGAHSFLPGYRFANLSSPRRYIQRIREWSHQPPGPVGLPALRQHGAVEMVEAIDPRLEMAETMMLGLRLSQGVAEVDFIKRFGTRLQEAYGVQIQELETLGLLCWEDGRLQLTPRGRLLGNEVFQRFLAG